MRMYECVWQVSKHQHSPLRQKRCEPTWRCTFRSTSGSVARVIPTCCAGAVEAVLRRHGRVNRGGGAAAEVHHGRCGRGRRGGWRGLLRRLCCLPVLVTLGCVGGDAVLRQELLQVHVLQLEVVAIVGQGLVPESRAQESRLWVVCRAALIFQLLPFILVFSESCKCLAHRHVIVLQQGEDHGSLHGYK